MTSIDTLDTSARSVAGFSSGGPGYGVFAYVTDPPTACQPPKVNFPVKNVEFSSSNSITTTINGDLRSNGSIWAGSLTISGVITFGCQIGPINSCHTVCDPAIQDTDPHAFPPNLPLTQVSGLWVSTDLQDVCNSDHPNVYRMTSGNPITTAQDQNGIVRYHPARTNTPERGTFDPGVYCVNGPIVIPNASCAKLSTSTDVHTCFIPNPQGSTQAGEGVTFVALGANGWIAPGQGGACTNAGLCSVLPAYQNAALDTHNVVYYAEAEGGGPNGSAILPGGGTNGNRVIITGLVAAPNGMINGGGLITFWGGWAANTIKITGGGIIINANGSLGGGGVTTTLVE
jgi:hypothetical protein